MRKARLIFLSAILSGFISVFGSEAPRIEVVPPDGWAQQVQRDASPTVIFQSIAAPDESGFRSNIVITRGELPCCKEGTPPDSLIQKIISQLERALPMFKVLEKGGRKIKGIKGGYVVTSYAQGKFDLANYQFFFLQQEKLFNVVYTCPANKLKHFRPAIEKSLESLKLSGNGAADNGDKKTKAQSAPTDSLQRP